MAIDPIIADGATPSPADPSPQAGAWSVASPSDPSAIAPDGNDPAGAAPSPVAPVGSVPSAAAPSSAVIGLSTPTTTVATMTISGELTPDAAGVYHYAGTYDTGRPYYVLDGEEFDPNDIAAPIVSHILRGNDGWTIVAASGGDIVGSWNCYDFPIPATPNLCTTWEPNSEESGSPTITAGTATVSDWHVDRITPAASAMSPSAPAAVTPAASVISPSAPAAVIAAGNNPTASNPSPIIP